MEQKEEVLKQIDNINSSFLEIEKFVPFSANTLITWGVISVLLHLFTAFIFSIDSLYGVVFYGACIFAGYSLDIFFTKKEMKKFNLKKYSKIQVFIEYVFGINIAIAILLTTIFSNYCLSYYTYSSWVLFIGFAHFITGYTINNHLVQKVGLMMVLVAMVIFIIISIGSFQDYYDYIKYVTAFFGGFILIVLGFMMKRSA